MATNVIRLADLRPHADEALVRLIADAIASGGITVVIGDLGEDPVATLARDGEMWTFSYRDGRVCIRDGKGAHYLATLLENPGVEIHALELAAAKQRGGRPADASVASAAEAGLEIREGKDDDAGPRLDAAAKRAYRTRLRELHDELEEADSFNDPERASRAREEIDFLRRELAAAVGLGGRDRRTGSDAERARVNVTRALRRVLERVAEHDAALGLELKATVRTGTFCAYEPDPRGPVTWRVVRSDRGGAV